MKKTYEEAIEKTGKQLKAVRWSVEISGDNGAEGYAELRGAAEMIAFLFEKDSDDVYADIRKAAE